MIYDTSDTRALVCDEAKKNKDFARSRCSICRITGYEFYLTFDVEQVAPLCSYCIGTCISAGIADIELAYGRKLLTDLSKNKTNNLKDFIDLFMRIYVEIEMNAEIQTRLAPEILERIVSYLELQPLKWDPLILKWYDGANPHHRGFVFKDTIIPRPQYSIRISVNGLTGLVDINKYAKSGYCYSTDDY